MGKSLVYAQLDDQFEDQLEDPIIVRATLADRTRQRTKDLKRRTNDKVDGVVEGMRLQQEKRIGRKLDNMFRTGSLGGHSDQVTITQSAPISQSVSKTSWFKGETSSFTLNIGSHNLRVSNKAILAENSYTSNGTLGMEFARRFSPRVDIGLGVNYKAMKFKEDYLFSSGGDGYSHGYNSGLTIDADTTSLEFVGRFYLTRDGLFRPYMTAATGVSYHSLHYSGSQRQNYGYSANKQSTSAVSGSAKLGLGVNLNFSKEFGFLIQGSFGKNFSADNNSDEYSYGYPYGNSYTNHYNYQDELLSDLSEQIANSSQYDITFGIMALF